jgi:hypothetical protein
LALIFHGLLAGRTGSENVDCVARLGESVFAGNLVCPLLNLLGFDLDRLATDPANQVVMVAGGAGTIEQFAILGLQRIGLARRG